MKTHFRFAGYFICIAAIAGSLSACGSNEAKGNASTDAETIYKQNCLSCHGAELQGKIGPSLKQIGGSLTKQEITDILHNGKGGMPSFEKRLDQTQIDALAAWLADKK